MSQPVPINDIVPGGISDRHVRWRMLMSVTNLAPVCSRALPLFLAAPLAVGAQAGRLPDAVALRVDSAARAELATTGTPGSALVIVQGDQIVYAKGYGLANIETRQPVTPDLLFRLGSTTKMMTSLAALSLANRGVVDLDRPIGTYVTLLASARLRNVTLRQLLTHTSGLLDYTSMAGPHDDAAMNAFVPTLTDTAFFTNAGDIMSYSNLGYVVAGFVISVVTGKPYADVMHDEVFGPLGMTHSTMRPLEAMTFPLAQGHQKSGGTMQVSRPAPDDSRYWPAGSAFASVLDFSRLAIAMMNDGRVDGRQVIPSAVVRLWLTTHVNVPSDTSVAAVRYGFGLETRVADHEVFVEHNGSRAGYGSMFRVILARKLAVIVLGNQTGIALRRTLDAATAAVTTVPQAEQFALPVPTAVAADAQGRLTGAYRNGRSSGFDLFVQNGELRVRAITATGAAATGIPVQRLEGSNWFVAGNNRFAIVTGADGKTTYLISGLRAMRKQN
jgi:CubicO group peptidase (beta-lactamase class C family)